MPSATVDAHVTETYHRRGGRPCPRIPAPSHSIFVVHSFFCFDESAVDEDDAAEYLPNLLSRHDERPTDISILDESLSIRNSQRLSNLQRRDSTRIGNGNDDVADDTRRGEDLSNVDGESVSHRHSRSVDGNSVEN